jgi:hypothetical protein
MMAKNISRKEQATKADAKYYYITMEKPVVEFSGETVEEFLARGGKINKIEKVSKNPTERDSSGKFIKKNAPIV